MDLRNFPKKPIPLMIANAQEDFTGNDACTLYWATTFSSLNRMFLDLGELRVIKFGRGTAWLDV